jgi:hypothetical protein
VWDVSHCGTDPSKGQNHAYPSEGQDPAYPAERHVPLRDRVSRAGDAGENPALGGGDIGESPTVGECQTNVYGLQLKDVRFRLENGYSNARIYTIRNSSVNYYP